MSDIQDHPEFKALADRRDKARKQYVENSTFVGNLLNEANARVASLEAQLGDARSEIEALKCMKPE